jgi:threonine synthase
MSFFTQGEDKNLVILVATSGDTGSAVAHGFYGNERIKVALLYPSGKVSKIQEQQLTTLENNIQAFEITGNFDDCQRLVKTTFLDNQLKKDYLLSSANSINVARLIPQSFYYFSAYAQLSNNHKDSIIFSVPCGNFGNLTAGIIAYKLGLPVQKFIAGVNKNDVFEHYLKTGEYTPKTAIKTLSNAMDVGDPSNFDRIVDLFSHERTEIQKIMNCYSISDKSIREGIREVYEEFNYLIDPHGAVGYQALKAVPENSTNHNHSIILETAHPAKFMDIVSPIINKKIEMPESLRECFDKPKNAILVSDDYQEFKSELLKWIH